MAIVDYGEGVNRNIVNFSGLSTDSKPTKNIKQNAIYEEIDTGVYWKWNSGNINPLTGNNWWEV